MGGGKVNMQDFHFTMKVNNASSPLLLACANGQHFKKADLTCRKAGKEQQEYLKIKLTDILVSSYQLGGHAAGDDLPVGPDLAELQQDRVRLREAEARRHLEGMVWKGWDQKANKMV